MLKQQLEAKMSEVYAQAARVYGRDFPKIPVRYDLKGRVAGSFCRRMGGQMYFRMNMEALTKYTEHFLANVVVHEFAHYAAFILYGPKVGHGQPWRKTMIQLGAKPSRCHTYDLTPARITSKFNVYCACGTLPVSATIVRKMTLGATYRCRKCKTRLSSAPAAMQLTTRTNTGGVFVF